MINLKSVIARSPSIVTRKTGNEFILVPVRDNIADMDSVYTLNETGAFIWEHIDGKRNLEEIIRYLTEEYNVDIPTASEDVFTFVNNLNEYLVIKY